jgi:hypothetical protein
VHASPAGRTTLQRLQGDVGDVTGALPNYLTGSNDPSYEATCQSGYGAVCKTVYPGSIPGVASIAGKPALAPFARAEQPTLLREAFPIF